MKFSDRILTFWCCPLPQFKYRTGWFLCIRYISVPLSLFSAGYFFLYCYGPGGNRTRVRKQSAKSAPCASCLSLYSAIRKQATIAVSPRQNFLSSIRFSGGRMLLPYLSSMFEPKGLRKRYPFGFSCPFQDRFLRYKRKIGRIVELYCLLMIFKWFVSSHCTLI